MNMEEQNEDNLNVDMTEIKKVLEDANIFEPNMTRELMISYYRALRNSEITASEGDETRRHNESEELERLLKKNVENIEITPLQNKEKPFTPKTWSLEKKLSIEGASECNNNENAIQDDILEEIISNLPKDATKIIYGFNEMMKTFFSDRDTPETYVCCSGRQTKRKIYNYEDDDDSVDGISNKKVKNPEEDEWLKKPAQNKNSTRIQKKQTNKINSEVNKTDSEIQDTSREKKTFMRKEPGTPVFKNSSNAEIMACSSIFNDIPKFTSEIMFEKVKEAEEKKESDEKNMELFLHDLEILEHENYNTIPGEEIIDEELIDDTSREKKAFMRKEPGTPVSKNSSNAEIMACSSIFNDIPKFTSEIMFEKVKEAEEKKESDEKNMELFLRDLEILEHENYNTIPGEEIIDEELIDDTSREKKTFMRKEPGTPVSKNSSNAEIMACSSIFNDIPKFTSEIMFEKVKEAEEKKQSDEKNMELFLHDLEILEHENYNTIPGEEIIDEELIDDTSREKKAFMRKEPGTPVSKNSSNAEIMACSSIFNDIPKFTSEIMFEKVKEAEEKKESDEKNMELFLRDLEILEHENYNTIPGEEIIDEELIDDTSREKKAFMRKEPGTPVSKNSSNAEIMACSSIFNDIPKFTSEIMFEKVKEAEEKKESDEKNMELFLRDLEILEHENYNTIPGEEIIDEELIDDTSREKKAFMRKEPGTPVSKNSSNAEIMACSSIFNDIPKFTSEIMFEKVKEAEEKKESDEKNMELFLRDLEILEHENYNTIPGEEIIDEELIDDTSREKKAFMRKEPGTPVSKNSSNAEIMACSSIFNDIPKFTSEIMFEKVKEAEEKKESDEKNMELFLRDLEILEHENYNTIPGEEIIDEELIDDTSREKKAFMRKEPGTPVSKNSSNAEIMACSSIFNDIPKFTSEIMFEKVKEAEEKKESDEKNMELFLRDLEILEHENYNTIPGEEIIDEELIDDTSREKKAFMRKEPGTPVSKNSSNAEIMACSSIFNDIPKFTSEIMFEKVKEAEEKKESDEKNMELFLRDLEILEHENYNTIPGEEIIDEELIDDTSREKKTFMRKEPGTPVSKNSSNAEIMACSNIFNNIPKFTSEIMFEKVKEAQEKKESDEKNMELFLHDLEILEHENYNTILGEEIIDEELIDGLAPLDIKVSTPTPKKEGTAEQNRPSQGKEEQVLRTYLEKRPPILSELETVDSLPSTSGTSKATIVTNNVICPICDGSFEESKIEEHAATCGDDPVSRSSSKISSITCTICDKALDFDTSYEVHVKECISKKKDKD